jgi:hypothetical protein
VIDHVIAAGTMSDTLYCVTQAFRRPTAGLKRFEQRRLNLRQIDERCGVVILSSQEHGTWAPSIKLRVEREKSEQRNIVC